MLKTNFEIQAGEQKSAQLIKKISVALASHLPSPEQHAHWILEAITQKQASYFFTHETIFLSQEQQEKLTSWLQAIIHEHMPVQYLIGTVPFGDLTLHVQAPTLIPRPETEEWVLNLAAQLSTLKNQQLAILDMCTGSGCIALTLAHALPKAKIYATDISGLALALAKKNAIHNQITNITFLTSDLFALIPAEFTFDLIVSNPPYISREEWQTLEPSVKLWEDTRALIAADSGLAILEKIIAQAPAYLRENSELAHNNIPQLLLEIGHQQGMQVYQLMRKYGYHHIQVLKDLAHQDRLVTARLN
jgi:release factor glutamine methyltransferase